MIYIDNGLILVINGVCISIFCTQGIFWRKGVFVNSKPQTLSEKKTTFLQVVSSDVLGSTPVRPLPREVHSHHKMSLYIPEIMSP